VKGARRLRQNGQILMGAIKVCAAPLAVRVVVPAGQVVGRSRAGGEGDGQRAAGAGTGRRRRAREEREVDRRQVRRF
jgi:hypothetical protein